MNFFYPVLIRYIAATKSRLKILLLVLSNPALVDQSSRSTIWKALEDDLRFSDLESRADLLLSLYFENCSRSKVSYLSSYKQD